MGGYSVEVLGYDGNKVVLEVVDDHNVNETNDNDDIGLQGCDCNMVDEYEGEEK